MHATQSQRARLQTLKKRADFLSIQSKGRKWVSHGLTLQTQKLEKTTPNQCSSDQQALRIGYTVTKRTEKSAVKRNRIKRRLRAVAADILSIHAADGVDYILVGRPLTATRPYADLCKDLIWCLKKLELYKDDNALPTLPRGD
jgi:ribonuclease P protein component